MLETSARLLALLGLLQSRVDWSGPELAAQLGVTDRTVRNDMNRLRELGYPVDATRGPGGRYRLGAGAKLPPLLLDEDEAVAVAVGLRAATGMAGFEQTGTRALTKLEHVLPDRLRRRLTALRSATSAGPANTDSNVEDPAVDPDLLSEIAAAVRDHQGLRCDYRDERLEIEPYHLVGWQRRWYLVARDPTMGTWAPYRVDWLRLRHPGGRRFTPVPFPGDLTEFVVREVARTGWAVHARIRVRASAEEVIERINPAVGTVEAVTDTESVLVTGGDSLEVVSVWIGMLGLDFSVESPPALVGHLHVLADRYAAAVGASTAGPTSMRDHRRMRFRPATADDVPELVAIQEEAAVVALAHIFPQDRHPFPREEVSRRWREELAEPETHVYVSTDAAGRITGFAARRGDELLHFGTALSTFGTGLARKVHDALVATYPDDVERLRLSVLTENHRARRFWERAGWRPTGEESHSPFEPHPAMLEYALSIGERGSLRA